MKYDESEIKELVRKAMEGDAESLQKLRENGILKSSSIASYPLSHAQRRLWTLCQFDGGSVGYNMPGAFLLEGCLDISSFDRAFVELIRRHESLRTAFVLVNGEPRQQIMTPTFSEEKKDGEYLIICFSDLSKEINPEAIAKDLAYKDALTPFELEKGMLLRVSLLKAAEDRHIMIFNMHHIISDGWSVGILIRELCLLYDAFRQGRDNPLSPLRIQYKDYAAWQKQFLESNEIEKHRNYWHQKLSGEIPVLNLPADFPRPSMQTFRGELISFQIDAEQTRSLRMLAYTHGASLFMVLLAIVKVLLYRYTAQTEIIVGIPAAGRNHPDIEDQIGFYVNTLALRDVLDETADFSFLLKQIIQTATDAYGHQTYPFDKLVEELNLRRDFSRSPIFDVMVAMQNAEEMKFHLTELDITPFLHSSYISKFDLTFNFWEKKEGIQADIEFNTDLFLGERIERMASHLRELITSILTNTSEPISRLNILSESEKHRLLIEFNDTAAEFPKDKTIADLFEEQSAKTPDNIAVIFENTEISYRQLNEQANQIAHFLKEQFDIQPDDRVGVVLDRSEWIIAAMLGIMKAGGAYVPVDPSYPAGRIRYVLEDSSCKVILTEEKCSDMLSSLNIIARCVNIRSIRHSEKSNPRSMITSRHLAYIIYTSGSTGQPKGVMLEHRGFVNMVLSQIGLFRLTEKDRIIQFASCSFDASMNEIFMAMLSGAGLVCISKKDIEEPEQFFRIIEKHSVSLAILPPAYLRVTGFERLRGLRNLITAGESAVSDKGKFTDENHRYWNGYGPTEFSVCATCSLISETVSRSSIPIGKPISNAQILILDKSGKELMPIGVPGEICLSGAGLARGYLNRPELTAEKFVPHPFTPGERMYRTGDLGQWLSDGNIEFLGRNDDQVKIRGYRIETAEIAKQLLHYPGIKEAIVIAKDFNRGYKELAAYIVSSEPSEKPSNLNEIRDYLKETLPAYMIPSYFILLNQIPLTPHGKTDHRALPEPEKSGVSREETVMPRTDMERRIADIWKETLKTEQIGIRDNFFDLGGDSLLLIKIRSRLQEIFQQEISVVELFKYPTIQSLSAYLSRAEQTAGNHEQPLIRHDGIRQRRETRLKHRGKNDE